MGAVWEAWDERLQRPVALKLLHRESSLDEVGADLANQRAMREARITARLHHRYAVPVFDVIEHDGQVCLVMPFLPSMTLAAVLREAGALSVSEAVQVGAQIASALAAAHRAGIVHRDVKPGNILITEDGAALISDFGIAHALGDVTLTTTGLIHGTPAYLAPEVARGGEATYASDVFSFGATLYASLEGNPPFGEDQNSIVLLHRVAAGRFDPPQHAGELTPLIVRMLASEPNDRPTMAEVSQALSAMRTEAPRRVLGQQQSRLAPTQPLAPTAPAVSGPEVPTDEQARSAAAATSEQEEQPGRGEAAGAAGAVAAASQAAEPTHQQPEQRDGGVPPAPHAVAPAPTLATEPPRRRARLAVLLGAALLVGLAIVAILLLQQHPGGTASDGDTSTSGAPVTPSAEKSSAPTSPSPSPTRTVSPSPSRSTPTATPSRARPKPSPSRTSISRTPSAAQLAGAITSYYAVMPQGTDQGWPRMTADYQINHAGGRTAYENFWNAIRRVSATNVSGQPPDHAVATITYWFRDGRVVRERTSYRLVRQDGILKIAQSTVLSSVTL
jgi:serine/threonine protein kinase